MRPLLKILAAVIVVLVAVVVAGVVVLNSLDPNRYRGFVADEVEAATGRKLTITGDLGLDISLNPAIVVENVALANASWGSRPEMATVKRLEAEVELIPLFSGDVRVTRMRLEGLDILLETNAKGQGNWEFATQSGKKPETRPTGGGKGEEAVPTAPTILPLLKEVHGTDLKLTYRDGRTGRSMAFVLHALTLGAEDFHGPLKLAVKGVYENLAFSANGTLGSIDLLDRGGTPYPVALQGKAPGVSMRVEGTVAEPLAAKGFDLSVSAQVDDLSTLAKATRTTLPALPPFNVTGTLKGGGDAFAVDHLDVKMGEIDLSGNVALDLKGKRPAVQAVLSSKRLDLTPLLSRETKAGKGEHTAAADDGRVFSPAPLPFDHLDAVDADFSLKVGRLVVDKLTVDDIAVKGRLRDGRLKLAPVRAKLAGGTAEGTLSVEAGKLPALALKFKARQLPHGLLFEPLGITEMKTGKVDLDVDVSGSGNSIRRIMAGLDGRARLLTKGGEMDSIFPSFLMASIKNLVPFLKSETSHTVRCAIVEFDVDEGRAKSKAIVLETDTYAIIGKGDINLADETIDIVLTPRVKTISLMKLTALRGHIGGTLASPSVTARRTGPLRRAASFVRGVAEGAAAAVEKLFEKGDSAGHDEVDPTDYCALAAAGKPLVPEQAQQPKSN